MSGLAWFAAGVLTALNAALFIAALYLVNRADALLDDAHDCLERAES